MDDGGAWECAALLGGNGKGRGGGWVLERGGGLAEGEERGVREVVRVGGREGGLLGYPVEGLYPVGEGDHAWRWVYRGVVEGEGRGRVPQVLVLPEEPLVGYWERYLLGLARGEVDVWRYAQGVKG